MTDPTLTQDPAAGPTAATNTERAPLRDLWPYLRPHRGALAVVVAISLIGAALFLAQPALVSEIISRVSDGRPFWPVAAVLAGLLLGGALVSGLQQYLL